MRYGYTHVNVYLLPLQPLSSGVQPGWSEPATPMEVTTLRSVAEPAESFLGDLCQYSGDTGAISAPHM